MIITLNTTTKEVRVKVATKRETELLTECKHLLYKDMATKDQNELAAMEIDAMALMKVTAIGLSSIFYHTSMARKRFIKMLAHELWQSAEKDLEKHLRIDVTKAWF